LELLIEPCWTLACEAPVVLLFLKTCSERGGVIDVAVAKNAAKKKVFGREPRNKITTKPSSTLQFSLCIEYPKTSNPAVD
jgi:hypothetical protein